MQYLAQMINSHLSTHKRVDIADIGSLELVHNPAKLDVSNSLVIPPGKSIHFDARKALRSRYSLHASLSFMNVSDGKREEILRLIDGLGTSIWETTSLGGQYEVPHVGTFYQEQGAIQFAQDDSSPLLAAGQQMANIQFVPIKRLESVKTKPPAAPAKSSTKKSFKQLAVTFAFIIIFINVGLLGMALIKKFQADPFDRLPVNLPEGRVNVKPSTDAPLPNALPMPIDSASIPQDSLISRDDLADTSGLFQSFVPEAQTEDELQIFEGQADTGIPIESDASPQTMTPSKSKSLEGSNNSNLLLQLNAKGDGCAIVLGAFSNAGNVERMKSKLESEGYKVYEEKISKLTRVGILVPCEDGNSGLSVARNKYNPEAWVFKIK